MTGSGQLDEAATSYRRALHWNRPVREDVPNDPAGLLMSFLKGFRSGGSTGAIARGGEAAAAEQKALRLINEGNAIEDEGRIEEALQCYEAAIRLAPGLARAHLNRGNVLSLVGDMEGALAAYATALAHDPDYAAAYFNMGNAHARSGRHEAALAAYRKALALKADFADAEVALGCVLQNLGQLDGAMASYRRALAINPEFAGAHCNLGNALKATGQFADAVASYRRALELKSDFAEAHCNLGNALQELGEFAGAAASYRHALEIEPGAEVAHYNLGNALKDLGGIDDVMASYRRALEIKPDFAEAYTNLLFCLSHQEAINAQALFAEHCHFGEQFEAPLRASWPVHHNVRDPARCLQIGFLSGDLRTHPVAYFIEPLLIHLGASPGLALHAYYNHAVEDSVSARLRGHTKHWHSIADLSDAALAQKIGEDGIDILIDLSGHTGENRLLTFARRPAPVQASWMGYPGTTGLKAMDYYVADRYFLPPGEFDGQFTEKLVYLPATAPFLPEEKAPSVNALPALSKGYLTFGSFNRISKLRPSAIALWVHLLRALPGARMVLGGMPRDGEYNSLIDRFIQEGIERERLSFHARCNMSAYLALHHQVDMCLDTFPYTGGTTTNHALWMGVPTLTLAGPTPPGRQGAALLGHVGLDTFVAKDAADFQAKGLAWAGDLAALAEVRAGLRERCEQSPIRRPEVIAAGLECALRTMWQRWCAGLPAEAFEAAPQTMGSTLPVPES